MASQKQRKIIRVLLLFIIYLCGFISLGAIIYDPLMLFILPPIILLIAICVYEKKCRRPEQLAFILLGVSVVIFTWYTLSWVFRESVIDKIRVRQAKNRFSELYSSLSKNDSEILALIDKSFGKSNDFLDNDSLFLNYSVIQNHSKVKPEILAIYCFHNIFNRAVYNIILFSDGRIETFKNRTK